jgi:hypothetical protein
MDLIERYLIAVRRHLPEQQQDDIVQELGDSLRTEAEEHERASGHPLTDDEQAQLLKKRGHPWLMATRYLPQQHLIGPGLYPYYRQALVMVVFWVVLPIVLVGGAINAIYSDHPSQVWSRVLGAAWNGGIYAVGIVTIVFAVLERERVRFTALENWNPLKLRHMPLGRHVPRFDTLIGLVFTITFLIWWIELVRIPDFAFIDGDPVRFSRGQVWSAFYYPILASLVASIAIYVVDLVRPWRSLGVSVADIALGVFNIAIVVLVLRDGSFVNATADPQHAEQVAKVAYWVNTSYRAAFAFIGIASAWEALSETWRIVKARPGQVTALIGA